ncbi:MAG: AAA family ATPase [Clostridia bacterium]|nr:AAA family ATPase [Clostridia bacterium]
MTERRYIKSVSLNSPIDKHSYLHSLAAVKHLKQYGNVDFNSNVTFFVGENGTGKSTLIEAIAVAYGFNPEGGSRNFNFSTCHSHSELWEHITLAKTDYAKDGYFLRAESLYNVASNIDELDRIPAAAPSVVSSYGGVSLHHQSHGEGFLTLVQNRFGGNGLYILDEPEAALSPMRLLTLMIEMKRLVEKNSQFIIATHSPLLMAFPRATVYEFSSDGIRQVDYRNTDHYLVTKRFLNDPEGMVRQLLNEQ